MANKKIGNETNDKTTTTTTATATATATVFGDRSIGYNQVPLNYLNYQNHNDCSNINVYKNHGGGGQVAPDANDNIKKNYI